MNNAFFKFACVFIIAMFCLTPLSAIDLQDDNNNKYINQEDNETSILVDDVNTTDVDANADGSDIENNDDETSSQDSDINEDAADDSAIRPVKDNNVNSTKKQLSKSCPNLSAHINDITYGEVPVVEVLADKKLYARISMECPGFENQYKVAIQDGRMVYQFHEYDLEPGTYEVKLSTIGDSNFDPQEITTKFTVNKMRSHVKVENIDNIVTGEKAVINVAAHAELNGTAKIRLIDQLRIQDEKTVPITIENGKGRVAIEDMKPGYYRAIVEFDGDNHFHDSTHENSFIVYGNTSPNLKVEVDDIKYGEHPVIKVHANESVNGLVKIVTGNSRNSYFADIKNGYLECGEYEIPGDFDVGDYYVWVYYEGDLEFCPESTYNTFTVEKADTDLSIHVDDSNSRDEELHVVIDAKKSFSGNVTVTLNNRVWSRQIEVVDGHGEGYYPGGDYPGNYTAKAKFEGNKHYNAVNCTTTYQVKNI